MEFISEKTYKLSNIIEQSEKLFIQLWCEQFNPDTMDSYRARVMNAHSIIAELEEVMLDFIQSVNNNETNVIFVAKEAERIIKNDYICQNHFKFESDFALNYIKSFWDKPKKEELLIHFSKIKILKDNLDENYLNLIFTDLENAIFKSHDWETIQNLTKALATQLIKDGFSYTYLYERKELFLNNIQKFSDNFLSFKKDIIKPPRDYEVLFKFSAVKSLLLNTNIFSIILSESNPSPLITKEAEKFEQQVGELYGKILVSAHDPYSAVYKSVKSISLLQNITRFEYRKNEFKISPLFLIIDTLNSNNYLHSPYQRSLGFISSGKKNRFDQYLKNFNSLLDSQKNVLDKDSTERILNSFHYFRLSLDSVEPETRFLHNWISLEYLIKININKGLIDKVVNYIPKLLVSQYFNKLLKDFSSNLLRLRCNKEILADAGIIIHNNKYELSSIYNSLRDERKVALILSAIESSLLKMRVKELVAIFKDDKSLLLK